jgi:predicted ATPase
LVAWLADKELLLVLDNCEHVIGAATSFVAEILMSCHDVTVLATSRELLAVRGELAMPVPPMSTTAGIGEFGDAIELFVERARTVQPSFHADTPEAMILVQDMCGRLDGLPLAVELAAARVRTLSLSQIRQRLDERFRLLTGASRDAAPRQRTLESVVAWSYDLLNEPERAVFRRLAVFTATFPLEAAEAVCAAAPVSSSDVLDLLTQLVDKSLVMTSPGIDEVRFYLLETLKAYASDRLVEAGEHEDTKERLLEWALTVVTKVEGCIRTPRQDAAMAMAIKESASLRSALAIALARHDTLSALRIVNAAPLSIPSDRDAQLRVLLREVPAVPPGLEAAVHLTLANLATDRGDGAAAIHAAADAHMAASGDPIQQAWASYFMLFGYWGLGALDEAKRLYSACSAAFKALGHPLGTAYMLWIGSLLEDDLEQAAALASHAEEAFGCWIHLPVSPTRSRRRRSSLSSATIRSLRRPTWPRRSASTSQPPTSVVHRIVWRRSPYMPSL